jgi:hypothetical protein
MEALTQALGQADINDTVSSLYNFPIFLSNPVSLLIAHTVVVLFEPRDRWLFEYPVHRRVPLPTRGFPSVGDHQLRGRSPPFYFPKLPNRLPDSWPASPQLSSSQQPAQCSSIGLGTNWMGPRSPSDCGTRSAISAWCPRQRTSLFMPVCKVDHAFPFRIVSDTPSTC